MTPAHQKPLLIVLGGPNGAGKTTTAGVLLPKTLGVSQFVNADNIAAGLSPFAPETTAITAGKLMLKRIRELLDNQESFGFETTLAGKGYVPLLRQAKDKGYVVNLIYIWLASPELAISRVAHRVRQGGHDVPEETVRRRYNRGLVNFFDLYLPLANSWTLCDNSAEELVIVAQGGSGCDIEVFNPERLQRIERSAENARHRC